MGAIKGRLIAVLAGSVALASSGEASAAEVIGQTGPPVECGLDQPFTQQAVGAAPAYSPSAYGVITSWSAFGGPTSTPTRQLKLMVLEPAGGTSFKTVRKDTARTLTNANALNTFTGMSLPIEPTQRLGLYALPGVGASPGSPCAFTTMNSSDVVIQAANGEPGDSPVNYNFASASSRRLNASAVVEPDCDNDGLGDETQDTNLSSCTPGTTPTGPAPTLPGGAPATCRGVPATIVGTEGRDVRSGSQGPDVIVGLGGNDNLSGLAGNDLICGGKGKDKLKGGAGNDQLSGQKGNDKLYGQKGNDKLSGKAGNDTLKGGPGKDILKGGAGKDKQVQ